MFDIGAADHTTGELLDVAQAALRAAYDRASDHSRSALDDVSPHEVLAQIEQLQSLINTATAVQTVRLAEHASTERHHRYDPEAADGDYRLGRGPVGRIRDTAAADVQALLGLGPVSARRRMARAVEAVAFTPALLALMGDGCFDRVRLEAVTEVLADVPPELRRRTAQQVEQELLWRGVADQPPAQVRRLAQHAVYRAVPEAEPAERRRTIRERSGVVFAPGPIAGLSVMTATMPTQDATLIQAAVEEVAWRYHTTPAGPSASRETTLGQCRVHGLRDLLLAHADVTTTATLLVPVRAWESPWALMGATECEPPEPPAGWTDLDDALLEAQMAALDRVLEPTAAVQSPDLHAGGIRPPGHGPAGDPERPEFLDPPAGRHDHPPGAPPPLDHPPDEPSLPVRPPDEVADPDRPLDHVALLDRPPSEPDLLAPPPVGEPDFATSALDAFGAETAGAFEDVEVDGVGVIPADIVRSMLRAGGVAVRRALLDPRSGTLLTGVGSVGYSPSARLAEAVQLRDGRCRFPACTRPAAQTDLDHVVPYTPSSGGSTRGDNLQSLCRSHHRAKQSGVWHVDMTPDGVCTWTAISGAERITYPQHHPLARAPF